MKEPLLKVIKAVMPLLLRCFGVPIYDTRTKEFLGHIFVFRWKGKLRVVGLKQGVIPGFIPRDSVKYWYQDLGFSRHPAPDFPSIAKKKRDLPPESGGS